MSEVYEDEPADPTDVHICGCGCFIEDHDPLTGRCRYCFEDDCQGFEEDEEAVIFYLANLGELHA